MVLREGVEKMKTYKFLKKLVTSNDCLDDGIDYIEINYPYNRLGDMMQFRVIDQHNIDDFLIHLNSFKNNKWYKQKIKNIEISVNSYDKPIIIIRTKWGVEYESNHN